MVPGTSVFPLSESGMSRNFWGRIKGAKYRFALQDGRGNHSPIWGEEVFPWEVTTEAEQKEVTKVTRAGKETFR